MSAIPYEVALREEDTSRIGTTAMVAAGSWANSCGQHREHLLDQHLLARVENDQRSGCWKSAPDRIRPHTLDPAGIVSYKSVRDILTGEEFVRRVRRLGRERGVAVRFDPRAGKGSHGRLYYGEHFTTIKNRRKEIGAGLLAAMLRQLGLSRDDL